MWDLGRIVLLEDVVLRRREWPVDETASLTLTDASDENWLDRDHSESKHPGHPALQLAPNLRKKQGQQLERVAQGTGTSAELLAELHGWLRGLYTEVPGSEVCSSHVGPEECPAEMEDTACMSLLGITQASVCPVGSQSKTWARAKSECTCERGTQGIFDTKKSIGTLSGEHLHLANCHHRTLSMSPANGFIHLSWTQHYLQTNSSSLKSHPVHVEMRPQSSGPFDLADTLADERRGLNGWCWNTFDLVLQLGMDQGNGTAADGEDAARSREDGRTGEGAAISQMARRVRECSEAEHLAKHS